jgi:hypothetical protein
MFAYYFRIEEKETIETKKKKDEDKIMFDSDIQEKIIIYISYLIMINKK